MTKAVGTVKKILVSGLLVSFAITPIAGLIGWLTNGTSGLYGALLGFAIAVVFTGITTVLALSTKNMSAQKLGVIVLTSWLLKIVLLILFLVWLRGEDFYHRPTLLFSLLIGLAVHLLVESLITLKSKEIYVSPN
jgi:phosphoglycerol transferase MdoB-like AlkP superfamily enzyme